MAETKRYWTQEEVQKAKADKSIREKIIADMEEKMEKGKEYPVTTEGSEGGTRMNQRVATEDAIRKFCDGIGDINPLYRSLDYARNSIYGGIIAPPRFLTAFVPLLYRGAKLRGKLEYVERGFYAGTRIEWFKVIRAGDEFRVTDIPIGVIDLTRQNTALQFLDSTNSIYKNQRDEVVAIATIDHYTMIIPAGRQVQDESKVGRGVQPRHFTEQEVEDWYQLTQHEEIRGAKTRLWEDVNVGDELPPTHHVYTTHEYLQFSIGMGFHAANWGMQMKAHEKEWRRLANPESGLPDFGGWHLTDTSAKLHGGIPRAIALGQHMECWLGKLVTNWMGDTGFLKKMGSQIRGNLYRDSLALCEGQVVKKYIEGNEHLVDLSLTLQDHNGIFMIPNGTATVVLPSRRIENRRP